jgi:hypothetical protein
MKLPWLRFTLWRMMIAVAAVASVFGFLSWVVREPLVFVEPARPPRWPNADHDIYDIVLADLIDNPEFNFSIAETPPKKTQIIFHAVTQGHVSHKLFDFDRWPRENGTPEDVLDDMVERNPEGKQFTLADYQPSDPKIAVAILNKSELEYRNIHRFPKSCGYVVPNLPGYSRDGKTALFRFQLPPLGYHPGSGYYLLKKKDGCWTIAKKDIHYLL